MTIFADASALTAMIAGESDATELADKLAAHSTRICSAVSVWETMAALSRARGLSPSAARAMVESFLDLTNLELIPIGRREWEIAAAAFDRFGKGRHPAALNMGDCFAYACAVSHDAVLLYKGQDFAQTDLI